MASPNFSTAIPPEIFNYRNSPTNYFTKMAAHSLSGIALGVAVDKICRRIQSGYNLRPSVMILIQLIVIAVSFYVIEFYLSKKFKYAMEFQNITPGLLFAGLFFGVQSNLLQNIQKFVEPL